MFTLAQQSSSGSGGAIAALIIVVIYLAIIVLVFAGMWKMFAKAGQPGWAAIIPIYNTYILLKICGRPWWWLILMLIPLVSLVVMIIVFIDLAKCFGRGIGTTLGLIFLAPIFICILGFGSAKYIGPAAR